MNASLTPFLLAVLALLLLVACITDLKERRIPNWLNLAVAAMAPLWWYAQGYALYPTVLENVGGAYLLFVALLGAMAIGQMGGGDVKLATAIALWLVPWDTLKFFVAFSLIGGPLTVATHLDHRWRRREGVAETPYGLAIAAGAAVILAQRFLNQFAG